MQTVEGADAEFWAVAAGEIRTQVEGMFRHRRELPETDVAIMVEVTVQPVNIRRGNLSTEGMLGDGVREFGDVERRDPQRRHRLKEPVCYGRMTVADIDRNDETAVGVRRQ